MGQNPKKKKEKTVGEVSIPNWIFDIYWNENDNSTTMIYRPEFIDPILKKYIIIYKFDLN